MPKLGKIAWSRNCFEIMKGMLAQKQEVVALNVGYWPDRITRISHGFVFIGFRSKAERPRQPSGDGNLIDTNRMLRRVGSLH